MSFQEFEQDRSLCVVSLLDTYIERSKPWRQGTTKGQLLISFVKPHNEVVKSTISGWVKEVIFGCANMAHSGEGLSLFGWWLGG